MSAFFNPRARFRRMNRFYPDGRQTEGLSTAPFGSSDKLPLNSNFCGEKLITS
jgi:hypothetical protein